MPRPWRIVLTGEGPSRNDRPDDADQIAREMVKYLQSEGHKVTAATLQDDTGKNFPLLETAAAAPAAKPQPVPSNLRTADPNVTLTAPAKPDASPAPEKTAAEKAEAGKQAAKPAARRAADGQP